MEALLEALLEADEDCDDYEAEDQLSRLTNDVTLLSHTHGRERRAERGIARAELQAAVKHGRKERATPSRAGEPRWKYTHAGVVYVTDATSKHEITSWRVDDNNIESGTGAFGALAHPAGFTTHVVLLVDHSGSMRKDDVHGYSSRTNAVYSCLRSQFLQPQLDLAGTAKGRALGKAVVSIIHMSTEASVVVERVGIDESLSEVLDIFSDQTARAHGNYLPALDALDELLTADMGRPVQIVVFFLSDGAPSDHIGRGCRHGVRVWDNAVSPYGFTQMQSNGRPLLNSCGFDTVKGCREALIRQVRMDCCSRIEAMGDKYGRDRLSFHTVAFGPAHENFVVLQEMSTILPRSTFQKLGLSAHLLTSAFTSLTSTLTTMRTEGGNGHGMTLRQARPRESAASFQERLNYVSVLDDWDIYVGRTLVYKKAFVNGELVDKPLEEGATGVAIKHNWFAQGSERLAYRCFEVGPGSNSEAAGNLYLHTVGLPMVAKETIYEEEMVSDRFHRRMAKVQCEAERLAMLFNERVCRLGRGGADGAHDPYVIHFVPCCIYEVRDAMYDGGRAWILAELQLEGKFTKWNNNAGKLKEPAPLAALGHCSSLGVVDETPQAFSHFSWSVTNGSVLLCDLQGVWNEVDGFLLTDPAMHRRRQGKHRTDKGLEGMRAFFETHRCSALCFALGLAPPGSIDDFE